MVVRPSGDVRDVKGGRAASLEARPMPSRVEHIITPRALVSSFERTRIYLPCISAALLTLVDESSSNAWMLRSPLLRHFHGAYLPPNRLVHSRYTHIPDFQIPRAISARRTGYPMLW